jgi:hypothetical protein
MIEHLKFGLAGILIGAFVAFLVPRIAAWLVDRSARRRFVRYVQPTRYAQIPSLSDADPEKIGLMTHHVMMEQEDRCKQKTLDQLPRLGAKAPRGYEMMGRCFALLDAFSSCAWVCSGGDHVLERLAARALNNARAALRLTLMGFYDEAIALTRSVGEIANLLSLFAEQADSFTRWKSLDERTRRREFSPVNVRMRLEDLGTPMRIKSEVYAELSTRGVHVNPRTSPQTYDMIEIPKGGGYYQEAGLFICLNELAQALTFVMYASAQLSHLEKPLKKRMLEAGRDLIANTGRLGVDNIQEMWSDLKNAGQTSEQQLDLGDNLLNLPEAASDDVSDNAA